MRSSNLKVIKTRTISIINCFFFVSPEVNLLQASELPLFLVTRSQNFLARHTISRWFIIYNFCIELFMKLYTEKWYQIFIPKFSLSLSLQENNNNHTSKMVDTQHFCLRWNNYQSSITSAFENLRDDEDFVDVTLACDGRSLKAHRVVLSACSPYFRELLKVSLITKKNK